MTSWVANAKLDFVLYFQDCVKYICTGKANEPCEALGPKLDMCPELKGVSTDVRDQCFPKLTIP